jgi:hypothetical protein
MHWRPADTHGRRPIKPDAGVAVRAEGERVLAAWPFPTGWEEFRPDPAWPLPGLPEGWEHVAAR